MKDRAWDREALVLRNRTMAEAFHQTSLKHRARRIALASLAALPVPRQRSASKNRILLIRPDHLGDLLLTTPAINTLREAYPDHEIHALVGPWSGEVLATNNDIDTILTLPFPGFSRTPKNNWRSPYELAFQAAGHLRKIGYDTALILRPDHWWGALMANLAGIPRRIGYDHVDVAPFLTDALTPQPEHAVVQNMRLVERLTETKTDHNTLQLQFPVRENDSYWVEGYFEGWGIDKRKKLVAIHPGSGTWVKRWQEQQWARVADALHDQLDVQIIFTGSDHELPMVSHIIAQMKHTPALMVGDASIGQLAALYERCAVVLGPDSGPLHLASAVKTPTITLFGPADPIEFGTWGSPEQHIILTSSIGCRPCRVIDWGTDDPANHPCVRDITVERVLDAARRLLQRDRFG